jgi:transposase
MAQKQYIKHLYEVEGKSLREIARTMHLSFRTVQRYALQEDWNLPEEVPLLDPRKYSVVRPHVQTIDGWLTDDQKAPRKQRHTAKRVYDRLVAEEGFIGSGSSVRRYINRKRLSLQQAQEGYLPIAHACGDAQCDFGEFYKDGTDDRRTKAYALTLSFPQSNHALTQTFPSQNQECLLEGMKRIFEYIGGVPVRIRFDNMTTAVAQMGEGTERTLSDGFARFMLHYRFQADFCNPASGHEKGNVENKVGYSRRNFFVPIPIFDNFESYNEQLWSVCEADAERPHYKQEDTIAELFRKDREKLLLLPEHPYRVFRYETLTVNKYGFVTIDTNHYGLSPQFAGQKAQAKIFSDKIELYYERSLLKTYQRSYESKAELMDWTQYLGTLCKKPGAVEHTRFFGQLPKLWQNHLLETKGIERKSALMLLSEIVSDGNALLSDDAIQFAYENGRHDTDSIRQCYYNIARIEKHPMPLLLSVNAPALNYHPDLSVYDHLTGGSGRE